MTGRILLIKRNNQPNKRPPLFLHRKLAFYNIIRSAQREKSVDSFCRFVGIMYLCTVSQETIVHQWNN